MSVSSPPAKRSRFATADDQALAEAHASATAQNTQYATKFWLRVFDSFCEETGRVVDLKTCSPKELDECLSRLYIGLRNKNGEQYKKASYLACRAALSRHLVCNLRREECNIFRNSAFKPSNATLDGVLKLKKARGDEPAVEHKAPIAKDDLAKIQAYFADVLHIGDPVKLTYFCWFNLSLHFALRGAEVQIQLKKDDIVFEVGANGKEFVTIRRDFLSKNCQGGLSGRDFESCGRLREPKQVLAMRKLLSKLHPNIERIFQRALSGLQPEGKPVWFARVPLGHVVVGSMLSRICKAANVTRKYTNHCVRATSIVLLKTAGFDDRSVCHLTGHKNALSLNSYCGPSEEQQESLAAVLDGEPRASSAALSTISPTKRKADHDDDDDSELQLAEERATEASTSAGSAGLSTFAMKSVFNNAMFNFEFNPQAVPTVRRISKSMLRLKKRR